MSFIIKGGGTISFSKITEDLNQYNSPLFVIQCVKKRNYFFKAVKKYVAYYLNQINLKSKQLCKLYACTFHSTLLWI